MVTINLRKKDFWIFSAIIIFFAGISYVIAPWDATKTMFHSADDVKVSMGGVDMSVQEAINALSAGGGASSGAIVGGGTEAISGGVCPQSCSSYGSASCTGITLDCPAGSTKRVTGIYFYYCAFPNGANRHYYACIKD